MSIVKLTVKTEVLKNLTETFTNAIIFKFNNERIDILEVEKYKYSFGRLLEYEDYQISGEISSLDQNDLRRFARVRTASLGNFINRVKGENVIMTFTDVSVIVVDSEESDRLGKYDLVDLIAEFDPDNDPKAHAFLMSCTDYVIEGKNISSNRVKLNNNYIILEPKKVSYDNNKINTEYVEWKFELIQEDEVKIKEIRKTTNTNDINSDVWYYLIDENMLDEEITKWDLYYHMNIINDHYNKRLGKKFMITFMNNKPSLFFITSTEGFILSTSLKSYEPVS